MEILKLSKFKLQLQALISEVKQLKENERLANDQVQLSIQKQKLGEEEFGRKINDLQAELCLSNENRRKLEKKVNCLESDTEMLENKQKELKETISGLLQSKESFVKIYEDSFGEMKRTVEDRDRKIFILSEKIKAHALLFDTIEKEANSVQQVVDNSDQAIKEREELVAGFKRKLEEVYTWEKVFVEKINNLESKLKGYQDELKRKDKVILVLETRLEAADFSEDFQPKVDELQEALSAKEIVIRSLILEKQALCFEVGNLGFAMKKIQDAVSRMDEEDRKAFSSMLDESEERVTIKENEVECMEDVETNEDHNTSNKGAVENSASPECRNCSGIKSLEEDSNLDVCVSEVQSGFSQPQLAISPESKFAKEQLTGRE